MIQRIQTVYLILIALIAGLLIFNNPSFIEVHGFDKWTNSEKGSISVTFTEAVWSVNDIAVEKDSLSLMTYTLGIISALAFIAIFLFRNRKLQMMLTAFNYIFILILYILMIYYGVTYSSQISQDKDLGIAIGLFFPLFLPIFTFMALRRINYDEALVRSTNRLR
jgi:hypothetical protein